MKIFIISLLLISICEGAINDKTKVEDTYLSTKEMLEKGNAILDKVNKNSKSSSLEYKSTKYLESIAWYLRILATLEYNRR